MIGAILLAPLGLSAQSSLSIDVGSARLRVADSVNAHALSITPTFSTSNPRASFYASGAVSQLSGASTNSGWLDGSLFGMRRGRLFAELEGNAGGSSHSDGTRTARLLGVVRAHVTSPGQGMWLGGGMGSAWDGSWRNVVQADAGGWLTRDASTFSFGVNPTMVEDSIRYTDTFVSARRAAERFGLDASIGFRVGAQLPSLPTSRSIWGGVSATYWVVARLGLVAAVGTYPVDFTQGYPGGQYVSVSTRWEFAPPASVPSRPASREIPPGVQRWELTQGGANNRRFRVFAPGARSVEISGDFTRWSTVALTPEANGWWAHSFAVRPGSYEMNVRVNGGPWLVPPGMLSLRQEYSGFVGILVVR